MERLVDEKTAKQIRRREILKLSPVLLLGAFAVPSFQDALLAKGLAFHDWATSRFFRRTHLAPTFSDAELVPFEKFPINDYDVDDPGVDLAAWKLKVSGDVAQPGEYTLEQIQALPRQRQNTRHVCVEGWDAIGRFGGARLGDLLRLAGANPNAKFLFVECADDYSTSIDMPTALHSQSLLCYEMYDRPLTREHGAPVRLSIPTKVGYKNAKYITSIRVTDVLTKHGYWEDQGYSSYYGF
jgi:DMSO/TMAO reductase YedYZ molybdopterin-dependent catalytic subunit